MNFCFPVFLVPELSKAFREALTRLASEDDIADAYRLYQGSVENIAPIDESFIDRLGNERNEEEVKLFWSVSNATGVDEESKMSLEELAAQLDLGPEYTIPLWNKEEHSGGLNYWDDSKVIEERPSTERLPLRPRWHQLVGVFGALKRAFSGQPLLLADEVGLGKTAQVMAIVALLTHYRESAQHLKGFFSE